MSGAPPPGYNSESLLASQVQGAAGGFSIQPMAGGGMPAGYSGESLLAPQTAGVANSAIQPLQGGATPDGATPDDALQAVLMPSQAEVDAALKAAEGEPEKEGVITKAAATAEAQAIQEGLSPTDATRAAVVAAGVTAADIERRTAREPKSRPSTRNTKRTPRLKMTPYISDNLSVTPLTNILRTTAPDVPVMLEYYALSSKANYTLKGIEELMDTKRKHYARHERVWKQDLMKKWKEYETIRIRTLWKPIQVQKGVERAPKFATSLDQNSWRAGHRAILHLNASMTSNKDDSTLVVIPPLRGNILNLIKALESIPAKVETKNGVSRIIIDPGVFVVFSYPYYAPALDLKNGTDNLGTNVLFLSVFLDLFLANPNQTAVLVKHEAEAFGVGLALQAYRSPQPPAGTPLVNFLEPAYVLYTISSSINDDIQAVCVTSAELKNEATIPFRRTPGTPLAAIPRLFLADSTAEAAPVTERVLAVRGSTIDSKMPMESSGIYASISCNALKSIKEAVSVWHIIKDSDEPYLNLPLTITKTESGIDRADLFWLAFRFRYVVPHAPLCKDREMMGGGEGAMEKPRDQFTGSLTAKVTKETPFFPVLGAGIRDDDPPRVYQIRTPTNTNGVMQDWLSLEFTEDEALYLNSLGLSPDILEGAFTNVRDTQSWQFLLAKFMNELISTNCFLDETMILNSGCEFVREFMDTIHTYYIEKGLTKEDVMAKENEVLKMKLQKVLENQNRQKEAEQVAAINPPTLEDGEFMNAASFYDGKTAWGTLYIYDIDPTKEGAMKATNVIVINKSSGEHFYFSVRVPATQYAKDKNLLYKKIEALRIKYPGYFFIY